MAEPSQAGAVNGANGDAETQEGRRNAEVLALREEVTTLRSELAALRGDMNNMGQQLLEALQTIGALTAQTSGGEDQPPAAETSQGGA
mmetsp:Transcript_456/g.1683  ORF Transcript_456/g.1683 Transcript_456/m.1683 type:complete len:88 (+) Transcript_456:154-417(+)